MKVFSYDTHLVPNHIGIIHKNDAGFIFKSAVPTGYNDLYMNKPHILFISSSEKPIPGDIVIFNNIIGRYQIDETNKTHDIITLDGESKCYPLMNNDYMRKVVATSDYAMVNDHSGIDPIQVNIIETYIKHQGKVKLIKSPDAGFINIVE